LVAEPLVPSRRVERCPRALEHRAGGGAAFCELGPDGGKELLEGGSMARERCREGLAIAAREKSLLRLGELGGGGEESAHQPGIRPGDTVERPRRPGRLSQPPNAAGDVTI